MASTTSSADVQGRLWSARAEDWAEVQEGQVAPLYDDVLRRLAIGTGTELLDAGCGAGGFARLAAAAGARVSGLDAAPALVEIARRRVPAGDFRVGELEELPYADGSFDVVTGFNSFQYSADPVAALAQARRVTRPGGRVAAAVWGRQEDCEAAGYIAALGALLPPPPPDAPGPFALSEDGALEELVRTAGLAPLETVDVPADWIYPDEATALRGLLASGPAVRAIEEAGAERVRDAILDSIAPYRTDDGGYRMENVFRYAVAMSRP